MSELCLNVCFVLEQALVPVWRDVRTLMARDMLVHDAVRIGCPSSFYKRSKRLAKVQGVQRPFAPNIGLVMMDRRTRRRLRRLDPQSGECAADRLADGMMAGFLCDRGVPPTEGSGWLYHGPVHDQAADGAADGLADTQQADWVIDGNPADEVSARARVSQLRHAHAAVCAALKAAKDAELPAEPRCWRNHKLRYPPGGVLLPRVHFGCAEALASLLSHASACDYRCSAADAHDEAAFEIEQSREDWLSESEFGKLHDTLYRERLPILRKRRKLYHGEEDSASSNESDTSGSGRLRLEKKTQQCSPYVAAASPPWRARGRGAHRCVSYS